jgi:hypothetical protein
VPAVSTWRVCGPPCLKGNVSNSVVCIGDVSLNAEDRPHPETHHEAGEVHSANVDFVSDDDDEDDFEHEDEHEHESTHHWLGGTTALKFLLAGGIAGAGTHILDISKSSLL